MKELNNPFVPSFSLDVARDQQEQSLQRIFEFLKQSKKRRYIAIDEFQQITVMMRRVFYLLLICSLTLGSWAQTKQELASEYAGIVDSLMQAEQYDSAAYYVTLRAELDTTNAGWQFDAGYCLNMMQNIEDATLYYKRASRLYKQLAEKSPSDYIEYVLMTLDYSAHMYQDAWLDNECEASYKEMLGIYRQLVKDNPQRYKPGLAMTLNNMGFFYQNIQLFEQGEPLYKEAL